MQLTAFFFFNEKLCHCTPRFFFFVVVHFVNAIYDDNKKIAIPNQKLLTSIVVFILILFCMFFDEVLSIFLIIMIRLISSALLVVQINLTFPSSSFLWVTFTLIILFLIYYHCMFSHLTIIVQKHGCFTVKYIIESAIESVDTLKVRLTEQINYN